MACLDRTLKEECREKFLGDLREQLSCGDPFDLVGRKFLFYQLCDTQEGVKVAKVHLGRISAVSMNFPDGRIMLQPDVLYMKDLWYHGNEGWSVVFMNAPMKLVYGELEIV